MHVGVCDLATDRWPAGAMYVTCQLCSLCLLDGKTRGFRLSLVARDRTSILVPEAVSPDVACIQPPPERPPGRVARLASAAAGRLRLAYEPRMRAWDAWAEHHELDVLLSFHPPAWWRRNRMGVCVWIPDFQHKHLPQYCDAEEIRSRDAAFERYADKADVIVLSSETSRQDFHRYSPLHSHKARVFQFPSLFAFRNLSHSESDAAALYRYGVHPGYFLVLNQFWRHKNHLQVLDALDILRQRGRCPQVVMIGHPIDYRDPAGSYLSQVLCRVAERQLQNNVKILGFVPATVRDALLRRCTAVIQPSEFEGWGTTVEDAKALGRPVLVSDIAVHREQCPQAFGFFELGEPEQLADLIAEAGDTLSGEYDRDAEIEAVAAARTRAVQTAGALAGVCAAAGESARSRTRSAPARGAGSRTS